MKPRLSLLGICGLLLFVFLSCQKDTIEFSTLPTNAKLKQVLLFSNIDSQEPISIVDEYEYNDKGLISKVSSPMYDNGTIVGTHKYDIYEYNSSDQLTKILNYNGNINSPTGFINLKNTFYLYSADGKKIKETTEYPFANLSEYSDFEYKDNQLVKIKKFSNNQLENYIEYQYDKSGRLIKELFYAFDDKCLTYTIHTYSGPLQIKSELFSYPSNSCYRSLT
jgi:hypothetical protein